MKISRLSLKNFCGIKELSMSMPQIVALCGKNGMGKTTLLNGLRFALTGAEPEGDIIRNGSMSTEVTIELPDDKGEIVKFTRIKDREKPSKFKINGSSTTQKALNEAITDIVGIPLDKIEIISSADMMAAMKPQEFASFILEYIPEKLTLEKVLSFVPATTPGMIDIIDANLPADGIDLETLDEFDAVARAARKQLKADLQAKKLIYDKHIQEKPEDEKKEVEERLKVLSNIEAESRIYEEKLKSYDTAMTARKNAISTIEELKKQADEIKASRPDAEIMNKLREEKRGLEEKAIKQQSALAGVATAISTLEGTLESINSSVCPISPLITCKTDKSVAKQDIEDTLKATKESRDIIEEEIASIRKSIEEVEKKITEENTNVSLYDKKISLTKQIKTLEDSLPAEPVKPDPIEKVDVETERFQLEKKLANIKDYEEGCNILQQIQRISIELDDYEEIVKMLAEKGPVRIGVVQSYLGLFESICNERSAKIRPECTFRFASKNGVVVYMKNETTGTELTMSELSGGEKAYMLYILIDMLNELVGSKILMLDELSVMDTSTFSTLLDLVLQHISDYDHIILSTVDHAELKEALTSREIDVIESFE